MKIKCFILVCIILSVTLCSYAAADGINLTNMTSAELLQLKEQIDGELTKRGDGELLILPAGTYIVGEDIAAGKYLVHFYKKDICGLHIEGYRIGLSQNDAGYKAFPTIFINNTDGDASLSLEDGVKIVIDIIGKGYATIEKYNGLFMD